MRETGCIKRKQRAFGERLQHDRSHISSKLGAAAFVGAVTLKNSSCSLSPLLDKALKTDAIGKMWRFSLPGPGCRYTADILETV